MFRKKVKEKRLRKRFEEKVLKGMFGKKT